MSRRDINPGINIHIRKRRKGENKEGRRGKVGRRGERRRGEGREEEGRGEGERKVKNKEK